MSDYEKITPDKIEVGDTIFTGAAQRKVYAVEYREKYSHPGQKTGRPAYLVTLEGFRRPAVYRPKATVIRKKCTCKDGSVMGCRVHDPLRGGPIGGVL